MKLKKTICFVLTLFMLAAVCGVGVSAQSDELHFDGGKFTVLQITDTQDDHYPARDMLNLIKLSLEETKPDLVVISGDIVEDSRIGDLCIDGQSGREGVTVENPDGSVNYEKTLQNVETATKAIFGIFEQAKVPFALTQGNNDYASGITTQDWLKIYSKYDYCLTYDESDDSDGRIDYNLEILSGDLSKTVFNIYLTDTGRNSVTQQQLDWYKAESNALKAKNGGVPVPSIVFQHIHVAEIGNLFERCNMWDDGAMISGSEFYRLNKSVAGGEFRAIQKPGETSDEFAAWKAQGDVIAAFFGHLHNDGYSGVYDGIELGLTYGAEFAKLGPYGVRVITLDESNVTAYTNELFTYEGSVDKGNAKLVLQQDEPYRNNATFFEKFAAVFINMIANLIKLLG